MDITLSIIVAAYNVEDYIVACMESLVAIPEELRGQIEVVVINDGSTDSTPKILKKFSDNYEGFIYIHDKSNGGLSSARNFGIEKANGKFIWFVDGDDYIEAKNTNKLLSILAKTCADYLVFQANRVDENNQVIGKFYLNSVGHENETKIKFSFEMIHKALNKHMSWMRVYKKSIIGDTKFPKEITHEDIHFDLNILLKEPVLSYHDMTIYNHNFDNPDSITNTMNLKKYLDVLWVFQDLGSEASNKGYAGDEMRMISAYGVMRRLMYILTLKTRKNDQSIIFDKYSEEMNRNHEAYACLNADSLLSVWDKIFIKMVKLHLFTSVKFLVKLKALL